MRPPVPPTQEREIADLRIRRSWWGKAVLQVRRRLVRPVLFPRGGYESVGVGPWRDVRANNLTEVFAVTALLASVSINPEGVVK